MYPCPSLQPEGISFRLGRCKDNKKYLNDKEKTEKDSNAGWKIASAKPTNGSTPKP